MIQLIINDGSWLKNEVDNSNLFLSNKSRFYTNSFINMRIDIKTATYTSYR